MNEITEAILVAVYTDGMGTWQTRCLSCPWRSDWYRTKASAVLMGKAHRHEDAE